MINTIEKISQFMETQNKAYVAKNCGHRGHYYKYKKSILGMREYNKKIESAITREKSNMELLKKAYQ